MSHYIGNLHEKGNPNSNLGAFSADARSREIEIANLTKQALAQMEIGATAAASLTMTEDGFGIGTIELESPKHSLRP